MSDCDDLTKTTATLMKEMAGQMSQLRGELEALCADRQILKGNGDDSEDEGDRYGRVVSLSEATKALLETAFSLPMSNSDRKKWVEKFGVPDCELVRYPKLDPVLKTTFPRRP